MSTACVVLLVLVIGLARADNLEFGAEQDKYQTLLDWIRDLGGGIHGASPQAVPGMGMGMVADVNLQVCVWLIYIPIQPIYTALYCRLSRNNTEHFQ